MLVLSRKVGESLYIDGNIEVTVVKLVGGRVRLGIKAPNDVSILWSERTSLMPDVESRRRYPERIRRILSQ